MQGDLEIEGLSPNDVLKVLRDYELEDRNDVINAMLLHFLSDMSLQLACIKIELKELRKIKEIALNGKKTVMEDGATQG